MQLTQIGSTPTEPTMTIGEMFRRLAEQEAEELRKAREKALEKARK